MNNKNTTNYKYYQNFRLKQKEMLMGEGNRWLTSFIQVYDTCVK
jgi:hypothetical protein